MSYAQQIALAKALTIVAGAITLIQAGNADVLGLSVRALAWLGIVAGTIAFGMGFLPSVRGMGNDPKFLANRIMDLSESDRLEVLAEIEARRTAETFLQPEPPATSGKAG